MNEYTPTTDEVETHWADVGFAGDRESFQRWLAEVERAAAAEALDKFGRELVDREMPEAGPHMNMTQYREGLIDGVSRAMRAASRRAAEIREEKSE